MRLRPSVDRSPYDRMASGSVSTRGKGDADSRLHGNRATQSATGLPNRPSGHCGGGLRENRRRATAAFGRPVAVRPDGLGFGVDPRERATRIPGCTATGLPNRQPGYDGGGLRESRRRATAVFGRPVAVRPDGLGFGVDPRTGRRGFPVARQPGYRTGNRATAPLPATATGEGNRRRRTATVRRDRNARDSGRWRRARSPGSARSPASRSYPAGSPARGCPAD